MSKIKEVKKDRNLSAESSPSPIEYSSVLSFTYTSKSPSQNRKQNTPQPKSYTYVMHDIKQTTYITLFLFAFSIVLFIATQMRLINLSVFGY